MKPLILLGTILSASLLLSGCDPRRKTREVPAPVVDKKKDDRQPKPGDPTLSPDDTEPSNPGDRVKIEPKPGDNIPPPPKAEGPEEYAKKMPGKPGFVTDPHDPQGRPLDVRGMPPGTKIQSPFSGSVLLVPPQ
jgi:hypothetical protein